MSAIFLAVEPNLALDQHLKDDLLVTKAYSKTVKAAQPTGLQILFRLQASVRFLGCWSGSAKAQNSSHEI